MTTETALNQDVLEEVRVALLDVKQAYSSTKIDLENLEGKVADLKPNTLVKVNNIEARINLLEKQLSNIQTDLHNLSDHLNKVTDSLNQYRSQIAALEAQSKTHSSRLNEISQLKSTLNSINQAISTPAPKAKSIQLYHVVSGDTLEKIARQYNITVDSLKKANHLTGSTIMVGQELKIPE